MRAGQAERVVRMLSSQANSDRQTLRHSLRHSEPGVSREAPPLKTKKIKDEIIVI